MPHKFYPGSIADRSGVFSEDSPTHISFVNLNCTGVESSVLDCLPVPATQCVSEEEASVICQGQHLAVNSGQSLH